MHLEIVSEPVDEGGWGSWLKGKVWCVGGEVCRRNVFICFLFNKAVMSQCLGAGKTFKNV